jgi:hypothetical protein
MSLVSGSLGSSPFDGDGAVKEYQSEAQPMPPSLREWMEAEGISVDSYNDPVYLSGRSRLHRWGEKRNFRILPHLNRMDICDGDYDRWANSMGASVPMPKTKQQLGTALKELLRRSARKRGV